MTLGKPKLLTKADVLFLAVVDLVRSGHHEFTSEMLAVKAWTRDPAGFGLRNHSRDHPDHKASYTCLIRKKTGLMGLGLVERPRPCFYRLTVKGLNLMNDLEKKTA